MLKYYKNVNDFKFVKPGKPLISCGIINFEREINPVGLVYSDVSLEVVGGRTKEYHGHIGLCSFPTNIRNRHVPDS
jgi:hypothetical protein